MYAQACKLLQCVNTGWYTSTHAPEYAHACMSRHELSTIATLQLRFDSSAVKYLDHLSALKHVRVPSLAQARAIIEDLKQAINSGGGYILGEFTFADISAAVMIQSVSGGRDPTQ